jgi:4-hydroxy-tetrahydrodipicolinate reductase
MTATRRLRLCVVGATGRMGSLIIREAPPEKFEVTGAVAAPIDPGVGKTLRELGSRQSDVKVSPPSRLPELLRSSDVCVSFTTAQAEYDNAPYVAESRVPIVMGTTGFTGTQRNDIEVTLRGRSPAIISSNFSVGANMLIALSAQLRGLPPSFDVSIVEAHHSGKADAPSGTAFSIAEAVSRARGYTKTVYGRSGISKRSPDELEISSLRGGGVPGEHIVYAFGPNEMLKLEHLAFSRSAFSSGALHAAEWLAQGREPRIYSMADVLGVGAQA